MVSEAVWKEMALSRNSFNITKEEIVAVTIDRLYSKTPAPIRKIIHMALEECRKIKSMIWIACNVQMENNYWHKN